MVRPAQTLHLDFETRSAADLRKCGAHRYAEDPTTEVIVCSYRFDDEPVRRWYPGTETEPGLWGHIISGRRVTVHNAAFERSIINRNLALRQGWPGLRIEQMDCTMSRGAALSLPQSLEMLGTVLGASALKDVEGHRLMMQLSRPRKRLADGTFEWWDDPAKLLRLAQYCDQDVLAEYAIDLRLPPLSAYERKVWELDQTINDRGVKLDISLIKRTIEVVEIAKSNLDKRMKNLTTGLVTKCSEAAKLAAWITTQGVPCDSVAKDAHEDLIIAAGAKSLPIVEEALALRKAAAKSSTAKLAAMLACACNDNRARGQLNYHGASTGRWAGRLIQPQNLHRMDSETDGAAVSFFINVLEDTRFGARHAHDVIETVYGDPMILAAKALRSNLIPAEGHEFIGGDLSNIEGCVSAWLADEKWKIQAYRDYQNGIGADLYTIAYARSFGGTPAEAKGRKRQIGKVMELFLGFQGAIDAFASAAANYGIKLKDIVPIVQQAAPREQQRIAGFQYLQLDRETLRRMNENKIFGGEFSALRIIVDNWRNAHPAIVQSWWDLQDAAIEAVANPGSIVNVLNGRIRYMVAKSFLWCSLPNGRCIAYYKPRLHSVTVKRKNRNGEEYESTRHQVRYEGYESEKKRWTDSFSLYGGLQFENVVQATARDVLVEGMFSAEARGYKIVLTVHDELLTEQPVGKYSPDELREIMSKVPSWCEGLPLAAKCWRGNRYDK